MSQAMIDGLTRSIEAHRASLPTMDEMAEGFLRLAKIARTLPRIEMRRVWFWQRAEMVRDGWSVRSGVRPWALRMQAAR